MWDCEHTVVDHQSVAINFADGATATLNMIGGTAKAERNLHIIGTKGEIKGVFDDSVFTVRTIDTASERGWREEVAVSYTHLGMTTYLLPAMELPYVVVMTTYPGASPEKIETTVTKPLEAVLGTCLLYTSRCV